MTGAEELARDNARKGMARFFLRIGRKAREAWKDEATMPLFGLPLILECEGLLAKDAAPQDRTATTEFGLPQKAVEGIEPDPVAVAYLARCERVIAEAARELRA